MKTRDVKIQIAAGLEARPVAVLVQIANQYNSEIYLIRDSRKVNAKSIMGMMTLGLVAGEALEVCANGADEAAAVDAVAAYLEGKTE